MTKGEQNRPLYSVLGQPAAIQTLKRALMTDRVAHAYLFEGPEGVGKEKTAFAMAQALLCETRNAASPPSDDACGTCASCRRVPVRSGETRPSHPDVIVLERGLYDPATIGRRSPETQDLSIDQIRTLVLARAAFPPHEGIASVYILRRAEELSTSAANALLKTLEEPGPSTYFILLSAVPGSLLSTIRSRTQRVRFGSLPDDAVATLLERSGLAREQAMTLSLLASGSMSTAAALSDADVTALRQQFVAKAMKAIGHSDASLAFELAEESKKHKEELPNHLNALAIAIGREGVEATQSPSHATAAAERFRLVLRALRHLRGNASAQLAVESMILRMRRV